MAFTTSIRAKSKCLYKQESLLGSTVEVMLQMINVVNLVYTFFN